MDDRFHGFCGSKSGAMIHIAAWILLALALCGIFCWRVATTDPRWRGAPSAPNAQTK